MSVRRGLALAQRLLAGVVLVVSGAYLLIYLYRWEWNRAIVSGLFFVAAEVALAASMLLRRMQRLEQRLKDTADASPHVLDHLRATPIDRPDPFAWLREQPHQLGVFVPVLLGAGAILSAIAYVVERVAEVTAAPVFDRRIARRLSALGLVSRGTEGSASRGAARGRPMVMIAASTACAVIAAVVIGWLAVDALQDATQSRPETSPRPATTVIGLSIAQRGADERAEETAEALWVGCRSTLGAQPVHGRLVPITGDRIDLVVEPGIGDLSTRRLTGCLRDLRINRALAHVVSVEHRTVGP